jgi:hypothetical protein
VRRERAPLLGPVRHPFRCCGGVHFLRRSRSSAREPLSVLGCGGGVGSAVRGTRVDSPGEVFVLKARFCESLRATQKRHGYPAGLARDHAGGQARGYAGEGGVAMGAMGVVLLAAAVFGLLVCVRYLLLAYLLRDMVLGWVAAAALVVYVIAALVVMTS